MNDTVNALPLPLLLVAIICGFVALVNLTDRTRTTRDVVVGVTALVVAAGLLGYSFGIAVAS